ncbi:MAG: T9SS type A sorting domain-containing protein [Bacteroidetes bacterium]|nr:T9SS type A sorting domain-containing protein [Bacteroidota bacterium]MBK7763869.1 T9SS type A sorting domain-containing protein [Bacteroidota bacterium]
MKKIIIATMGLLSSFTGFSQCPNTTGNYEYSISNDAKTITIKARNTTGTIRSSYVNPAINGNFVGLVFGIKWSAKSDVVLYTNSSVAPFDIIPSGGILQKENFSFQSYGDEAKTLPMLSKEFMNGDWHVIATIPYTGTLANGDKFELTECGFDETTNPYFAQMDKLGNYGQFAPNLVRSTSDGANLAAANAVIVYPNPTLGDLYVDVSSSTVTRATFKVMDMTGKTVKTIQSDLVEGLNKITVNVAELANGMYMLKVVDGKALNYAQTFNKQ